MRSLLIRRVVPFLVCLSLASTIQAQSPISTPWVSQEADSFYQQALSSYLDGNYDQAIILAIQSLEKDPGLTKTKNLLSVLTSEKEMEGKTVIWLAGKPALVAATPTIPGTRVLQDTSSFQTEFQNLRNHANNFYVSQARKNTQMNGQIQVIQELVKTNSGAQYAEFKKSQVEIYNQLEKIIANSGQDLRILYFLCIASMIFSFVALWKRPKK